MTLLQLLVVRFLFLQKDCRSVHKRFFASTCRYHLDQAPKKSDAAEDEGMQNDGAETMESSRKSGKQRDKDGHREGERPNVGIQCGIELMVEIYTPCDCCLARNMAGS